MRRTVIFLVAALVGSPGVSVAQRAEAIQKGAMVRVYTTAKLRQVGHLDSMTSETLALSVVGRGPDAPPVIIARQEVTGLDVRVRSRLRGALRGAALGFASGTISGFVLGAATHRDEENCWLICSRVEAGMLVGLVGAVIVTPIGIIGGASMGSETWKRVHPGTSALR